MNNELQDLIIRILKVLVITAPIWAILVIAFVIFLFKKEFKDWWKDRK
ncbi:MULTISPECIES: hypothetical protein [unclassified Lactococcus]|nr:MULTISPECIES: hypothetical protein [unclassified Lactococcus]